MSEPRTPRKKSGTKKKKSEKTSKKVSKNKVPTPLKIKIPTPVKKIKLTTPTKEDLNKIETIETVETVVESDGSDAQEGEDDEIDWQELEEELERNAAKSNLSTINVKSILHVSLFFYFHHVNWYLRSLISGMN